MWQWKFKGQIRFFYWLEKHRQKQRVWEKLVQANKKAGHIGQAIQSQSGEQG